MMGDVGMKEKGRPAGADKKRILLLGFFFFAVVRIFVCFVCCKSVCPLV